MSWPVKFDVMVICAILALIWIIHASVRRWRISSALVCDQIGMASILTAVLIYVSNFSGLFGD